MSQSLLRHLATTRDATEPLQVRYDEAHQVSYVLENGEWVPSWESIALENTKKCDRETGEDQKGV
jgi:hypothetical protein